MIKVENVQDNHIHINSIRPRFQVQVEGQLSEVTNKLTHAFQSHSSKCYGKVSHNFVLIQLPEEEQKYWSPQLSIMIEEEGDTLILDGLYGPRPNVWTMFVFFYFVIALATVIVLIVGFSNLSLGDSGMVLWLVPFLILIFCSLYLVAYLGQRLSRNQIKKLHDFVEDVLTIKIHEN